MLGLTFMILESMDIVSEFPEAVLKEAYLRSSVSRGYGRSSGPERWNRLTIDGADARTWTRRSTHQRLWKMAISSLEFTSQMFPMWPRVLPLNKEALNRATSVYVTNRVVPMLQNDIKWHLLAQSSSRSLDPVCYYEIDKHWSCG